MQREFVPVSKEFKGHVIGKRGSVIREIHQKSGAQIASTSTEEEGFTTSGNAQQIAHAKRLILQKVEEVKRGTWDLVEIPAEYKGLIIGKGGANLREISEQTGAEVSRRRGEVYITSGTENQREQAKVNIGIKLAGARLRGVENEFNKVCCFVDGCNLPENFGLKLEQVLEDDRMVLLGAHKQYRLKPSERFKSQESFVSNSNDPSYLVELARAALESLHMLKREREENGSFEADMWCHFGAAIIRGASEEEASEREWSIDEVTGKFQPSAEKEYWRVAFNEGVDFVEDIFKGNFKKTSQENTEYVARYDLTYLSPGGYQLRCKVWEAKEDVKKKLQDIPIPFSDVKNILEEIHFEDELTRSRCRGWLVYPSRRYLQADILFPGCEFDCRLTIRGRAESAEAIDYVPKEEVRRTLSQYLSGLALTKDEPLGLRLPENQIPEGFYLIHMRSSKRTVYTTKPGFSIILSKEYSWRSVIGEERARESTDLHLHCDEWDQLLSSGKWEPKVILQKLPEFLQFVKEVQGFVVREMQRIRQKVPPEILARGPLALEAYNSALAEGKTCVKRVPLMLIGQDRSGKTSLKKSLKGIVFNPDEDSTVGIDVDRYHFKVTTETWMTGKKDEESTCDAEAISFEYNAARLVAERLMKVDSDERRAGVGPGEFEIADMLMDTHLHESFTGPESIDPSSRDPTQIDTMREPVAPAGEVTDLAELTQGEDALVATQVQRSHFEEVAVRTETLLQNGLEESSNDIHSMMWDFAGQSVYYVTHPLFLTAKAIYLLAYDLSQNPDDIAKPVVKQGVYKKIQDNSDQKTNLHYLDFWMTSVASLASQDKDDDEDHKSEVLPKKLPAVFLVCTHADKPYRGCDPFELAYEMFGTLKDKPYGAHLSGVFVVDNTKSGSEFECEQVKHLREAVLAVAKELPHVNEFIPIKWLRYEKCIEILKNERHHISLAQAKHLASKECIIRKDNEILTLLNFLHDLRLLIHFDDTSELNDLVVLDPQWLIDIFKKVITVKPYDWKENQYVDLWSKLEREGILEEKLLKHVWSSLIPQTETFESLTAIMEKFSLLCPWPLQKGVSCGKQYLVPSMLKSHPPEVISDLVASAQIPSLFLKFQTGQVPAGFFPRLVLEFLQWCIDGFPRQEPPQLYNGFARFYILPKEGRSVVLLRHFLSIELLILTSNETFDTSDGKLAWSVRNQLASMIDCMQNKFFWVKNVVYELNFLCPVCCRGREVSYCQNHHAEGCKQEECLHFFPDSKLATGDIQVCNISAAAQDNRFSVANFAPWFPSEEKKACFDNGVVATSQGVSKQRDLACPTTTLNVTLLGDEWASLTGGLSTFNRELAINLAYQPNVEVTFLVPEGSCTDEHKKTAKKCSVKVVEAKKLVGFDRLDWLIRPPPDLSMDVVIGHGMKLGRQVQVFKDHQSDNLKWVQVVHTAPEHLGMFKKQFKAVSKAGSKHEIEVDLCKQSDLVVPVGPKLAEAYSSCLRSKGDQDMFVITPGLFKEFADLKQDRNDSSEFKVLLCGRGDSEDFELKGYDIGAEAFADEELKGKPYLLLSVGAPDGKEDEVARKLLKHGIAKEQLTVRKFVQSREKMKELFREVDLAIMPSRTEGFGLIALEALSASLPILVSSNSGFARALRNLQSGTSCIVNSKEPKDWAKAIKAVRERHGEELQEIRKLRECYGKKYGWEKQCKDLVERMRNMFREINLSDPSPPVQ